MLWHRPGSLLTNGPSGELVSWNLRALPRANSGLRQGDELCSAARVLHSEHPRIMTSVTVVQSVLAISVGHDRAMAVYDLSNDCLVHTLPSLAG